MTLLAGALYQTVKLTLLLPTSGPCPAHLVWSIPAAVLRRLYPSCECVPANIIAAVTCVPRPAANVVHV
jgi:hypothetical protein